MKFWSRQRSTFISNLLIAVVITVVINFSPLLTLIFNSNDASYYHSPTSGVSEYEGRVQISIDGYGYIVDAHAKNSCKCVDSIYVSGRLVRMFSIKSGDTLLCTTVEPNYEGGHLRADEIILHNNTAPHTMVNDKLDMAVQFLYFLAVAFIMLTIMTWRSRSAHQRWHYLHRVTIVLLLAFGLYFVSPVMDMRTGAIDIVMNRNSRHLVDWLIILKYTVAVVAIVLYGRIYLLLTQKQDILLENEQLRNENLQTRYNMLVGQINPHFFFNSLNSLAMLVREHDEARALEYIDQLSYTFRYIIQSGQASITTLKEEMEFAEAYAYLFKIRYADKLFFDIDIDEKYHAWTLPALSLQPLIGNAVKHNTITTKNPLRVAIRVVDGVLEVENRKRPKLDVEPSTGIGLANLSSRWQIVTGRDIEIIDEAERFMVRLPLNNPAK